MSRVTAALIGNPNSGKSTLFNALTGSRQRVGNWPGVTVERRTGYFEEKLGIVEVIDLPGIYAFERESEHSSIDERVACRYLSNEKPDVLVNVVDACHLERSLYLTVQLLELGLPVVVAVNRMDIAAQQGIKINFSKLAKMLNCTVLPITARKRLGITYLKNAININESASISAKRELGSCLAQDASELNLSVSADDADIIAADKRYKITHNIVAKCVRQISTSRSLTTAIDKVVLNRFLGLPIFLFVMYALFFFSLNIGGAFQDFFDISSDTIFVNGAAHLLNFIGLPMWLVAIIANGAGKGIHTTLTFLPVLAAMFFFLAILEDSGYMARAAFMVDRVMRLLGLPGKSLVPVIVGFGCNVPAVMAARTLESKRDRILTVMIAPFVPCGARLAIFTVFVAAFFPHSGANVVFSLYFIGITFAMLTACLLRKTVLKGEPSPLIMELPAWLTPDPKTILMHTWQRLRGFVVRAGKLIVPICMLIGALNTLNIDGSLNAGLGSSHSLLSVVGRGLTPIFAPIGLDANNWPATVGLITGVLAKEVVIGTLNTLYAEAGHLVVASAHFNFWGDMQTAFMSIPANFKELAHSFNPVVTSAPIETLSQSVNGEMIQRFHGKAGAFAYLLFVLLYFPCVSTLAVMWREVGRYWTLFSVFWSIGVAYAAAVIFYQLANFAIHPVSSLSWIGVVLLVVAFSLPFLRQSVARISV